MTNSQVVQYLLDKLPTRQRVTARAMFGGHGLYADGRFFAVVYRGRAYFKTDQRSRGAYVDRGLPHFRPYPGKHLTAYYEVPRDVLDDREELVRWARAAIRAAKARR